MPYIHIVTQSKYYTIRCMLALLSSFMFIFFI